MAPDRPDSHYLWVGRCSGFLVTMLGVLYALFLIERVLYSFLLTETLATFMGISMLGGMLWRRANRWGAMASLIAALATNFSLYYLHNERLDHWDANVFLAALLAGVAALVVVSLLTPPEPAAQTNSFFARLQEPTDVRTAAAGVVESAEFTNPEPTRTTAEEGKQSLLVNLLGLGKGSAGLSFWQAYRVDLAGLGVGWGLALALVAGTWLLFNW